MFLVPVVGMVVRVRAVLTVVRVATLFSLFMAMVMFVMVSVFLLALFLRRAGVYHRSFYSAPAVTTHSLYYSRHAFLLFFKLFKWFRIKALLLENSSYGASVTKSQFQFECLAFPLCASFYISVSIYPNALNCCHETFA